MQRAGKVQREADAPELPLGVRWNIDAAQAF